jgi:phosphoribosylformylglycinamidine synthase
MVGLISDERHITTQFFKNAGDVIILVGDVGDELGASRFLKVCHRRKEGLPPRLDVAREKAVQNAVRTSIHAGFVRSAHDCSEGGLAVAIAESCFNPTGRLGANLALDGDARPDVLLFNESQSRIVVSVAKDDLAKVEQQLEAASVSFAVLGHVTAEKDLHIRAANQDFHWPIEQMHDGWFNSIARAVGDEPQRGA